jgi:Flp pilus assembly protein TadD
MNLRPLMYSALASLSLAFGGCADMEGSRLQAGISAAPAQTATQQTVHPELDAAKRQFLAQNFGLSADAFRRLVEVENQNAEAWLGLAASYDELGRYDLADRAYDQVFKLSGRSAVLLNNRGFSYLKRGDKRRARQEFLAAKALDPGNEIVANNLGLLK